MVVLPIGGDYPLQGAPIEFRRDVESIFVKRCSECHGPDQQKAGLRLDSRAGALQAAKSGKAALVPGRVDDSELISRVTSADPDEVMPQKGARLTAQEVAVLRQWIEEGAVWPDMDPRRHWAFVTPVPPALPAVSNPSWVRNGIDHFILARLDAERLTPQVEADRHTLARRLSLDLTGLPPTWADVEAFVRDESPNAWEKLVDRLLESPHYGEHMARHWLDLARYADSNGYQVDRTRSNWPWREWVIRAFNRNMPFDQFTVEQLAGDLLPAPSLDQRIATGFNRNSKTNDEGGGDAEEYRVKAVKDRLATVGTTWMGLTLMCAECHSHKYDPVSQEEYYQLYAFFNNTTDAGNYSVAPEVEVPAPDLTRTREHLEFRLGQLRADVASAEREVAPGMRQWEEQVARSGGPWSVLDLVNPVSTGGSSFTKQPDGSLLANGINPIYDTILVEAEADLEGVTAVMLEVLPDPSLPHSGPGRWGGNGNFILDEFAMSVRPVDAAATPPPAESPLPFSAATADWHQDYYRPEHAVDRNPKTGWAVLPKAGQRHFLVATLQQPVAVSGRGRVTFRLDHYHGSSHTIGRFRISVTRAVDPQAQWPVPDEIRTIAKLEPARRSADQAKALADFYRTVFPTIRELDREIVRLEGKQQELAAQKFTSLVVQERSETAPRATHVQVRGNFLEKGTPVTPGVPKILPPLPDGAPLNRLTLARWLVDPQHPLTARVTVNQFWQRFFGTGLVKTSEDFGRQGEAPSHPELLDWLATEFVRSGWDVKAMQKLIVMSATYRQSAATDDGRLAKDFYNRLLSRGPRFRMDGEMIRDQALAVSGLLIPQVGGPSVHPVQVANLWKEIGFLRPEIGMDEWPMSEGPDLYRRGLYTFWRRVCTYPAFASFDAPSRDVCTARRPRTNTPLQALAALNEPALLEAARVFAQRIIMEGGDHTGSGIDFAFQTCVARPPSAVERDRLGAFFRSQRDSFRADPSAAAALVHAGSAPLPAALDVRDLAAWMMVANVLFNLDETLCK